MIIIGSSSAAEYLRSYGHSKNTIRTRKMMKPQTKDNNMSLKVTGESSIEIFATINEVVYISSRVHVSN